MYYHRPGPIEMFPLTIADALPTGRAELELPVAAGSPVRPYTWFWVNKEKANDLTVSVRLRNTAASSSPEDVGVGIPVVAEHEFLLRPVVLMDVLYAPEDFRYALRVFSISENAVETEVNVYQQFSNVPLATFPMVLTPGLHIDPIAYGEVFGLPSIALDQRFGNKLRLEVVPKEGSAPIWAFLSVTSTDSEVVRLVVP